MLFFFTNGTSTRRDSVLRAWVTRFACIQGYGPNGLSLSPSAFQYRFTYTAIVLPCLNKPHE